MTGRFPQSFLDDESMTTCARLQGFRRQGGQGDRLTACGSASVLAWGRELVIRAIGAGARLRLASHDIGFDRAPDRVEKPLMRFARRPVLKTARHGRTHRRGPRGGQERC
jgi:hypothetical protein